METIVPDRHQLPRSFEAEQPEHARPRPSAPAELCVWLFRRHDLRQPASAQQLAALQSFRQTRPAQGG